jgi:putative transposase
LKDYGLLAEAKASIGRYLRFYNYERPHQSLDYQTPASIYLGR